MTHTLRSARRLRSFILLVGISSILCAPLHAARTFPNESWMGAYLGKLKVGYTRLHGESAFFEGKPGYRMESDSVMKVSLLGDQVEQRINTVTYVNSDFVPVHETFKMSSGGVSTTVIARFASTEIAVVVDSGGTKTTKRIPIPPGAKLVAEDDSLAGHNAKVAVGDKMSFKSFDPLLLTLDDVHVEVLRQEDLVLDDAKHHCWVFKSTTPLETATLWQDDDENLLKVEMTMGFTMVRESKEVAQSVGADALRYIPPADLAVLTSAQTKTKIPNPRQARFLKVRLTGFTDKSLVIADGRQRAVYADGANPSAVYQITAKDFDPAKAVSLPIANKAVDEFLAEGPYIQPNDRGIKATAMQLVGDEKNAFRAASRIREWVGSTMVSSPTIGVVRSSSEILTSKVGVCRDYAVLYTALARAAGIPTKIVSGMTYWRDGFYYHAWAEVFVGEWVPMDATLQTDFVDATHIKLAEGDAMAMFKAVKAVGVLKAEILDFR